MKMSLTPSSCSAPVELQLLQHITGGLVKPWTSEYIFCRSVICLWKLMNQKRSEMLFVGSFKHIPKEFVLRVTSNLVKVHSGPGGQPKQNTDYRDSASGKAYCISVWSLTLYEGQTGKVFIVSWLNQYVVLVACCFSNKQFQLTRGDLFQACCNKFNIVAISNSVFSA